jgi:two-component sensor histidine kinase/tetratricopeptide (TPR) repeat protein
LKRVIVLLLIVFFTCNCIYAQDAKTIDRIIKKIENEQNDSLKCEHIFDLCVIYHPKDIAKYKYYAQILKTNAQKNKKNNNGLGLYSLLNASHLISIGDFKRSVGYSNRALIIFKNNNNKEKYLNAIYYNAIANYYLGNVSFAEKKVENALVIAKKYRFYDQIAALQYFIGCSYARKNQLDKALKAQNTAAIYYGKIKNDLGVINCYNEVITLYIYNENWDKATEYSNLILQLANKVESLDIQTKSLLYTTVASAYNGAKLYTKGLNYALKANKINFEIGNLEIIVNNLNVLTEIYSSLKETDLAIKYGKKIIQYPVLDKYKVEAYNLLAKNYQIKKNYKSALYYQNKSVDIVNILNKSDGSSSEIYRVFYKDLATIQYLLGDYTNAYKNLSKYTDLNNKVIKNEKKNDINTLLLKFDSKEKNLRLKEITLQKKNKELAYNIQQNYLIFTSFILLLTIIILIKLVFFYRRNKTKNKLIIFQNSELEKFSKQINESLVEKSLLLKEIHHRVKNNLQIIISLLGIEAKEGKTKNITEFLEVSETRIQTIALIHQSLYENEQLNRINFKHYLEQLVSYLKAALSMEAENISIQIEVKNIFLNIETSIPLALIINELLTNTFKYAYPNQKRGKVKITIEQISEYEFKLIYFDNGIGFDENQETIQSFGMNLVKMLTKQLKGNLVKARTKGTKYSLMFQNI